MAISSLSRIGGITPVNPADFATKGYVDTQPGSTPPLRLVGFGHSWMAGYGSTSSDRGIMEMLAGFTGSVVENFGVSAAQLAMDNVGGGSAFSNVLGTNGWAAVLQEQSLLIQNRTVAPRVPNGFVGLLLYGINDVGYHAKDTGANPRTAFKNALRTSISRMANSQVFEDTDTSIAYGGTGGVWAAATAATDRNSGAGFRQFPGNGATFTITIPADFEGGWVAVGLIAAAGSDAVVTWSGTATLVGGGTPSGTTTLLLQALNSGLAGGSERSSNVGVVKRFNLTAAAAGLTIIGTASTANGYFDYWQIEATNPTAGILVCGICRSLPGTLPQKGASQDGGYGYNGGYVSYQLASDVHVAAIAGGITAGGGVGSNAITVGAVPAGVAVGGIVQLTNSAVIPTADTNAESFYVNAKTATTITLSTSPTTLAGAIRVAGHTQVLWGFATDADVLNYNTDIQAVVAEFPSTVQYVDLDAQVNLNPLHYYGDGIHLNDRGAAIAAGTIAAQLNSLTIGLLPWQLASWTRGPRRVENFATVVYASGGVQSFMPGPKGGSGYTDVKPNSATWQDLWDSKGATVQVLIAAKAGDVLKIEPAGMWSSENVAALMTAYTVGGSSSTYCPSNASTDTYGMANWSSQNLPASTPQSIAGPCWYTVKPSDIVFGGVGSYVVIRLRVLTGAGGKTLNMGLSYPFSLSVENKGTPSYAFSQ